MDVIKIELEPSEARRHYEEYLKHRKFDTPMDVEIRRAYRAIAMGATVIKALDSIRAAGVHEDGTPKLGIVRADQKRCYMDRSADGSVRFYARENLRWRSRDTSLRFSLPFGTLPPVGAVHRWEPYKAIVPIIPVHLRPKKNLDLYHILWEADWRPVVPIDPLLIKRLGKGDLWLVVAAWDLTEVERAVLASRVEMNN